MAIHNEKEKYVTVEKGDTLSQICKDFLKDGTKSKYLAVAGWNNIADPDVIYIGEVIYIDEKAAKDAKKTNTSNNLKAVIDRFGISAVNDKELFATWIWNRDTDKNHPTASYAVEWTIDKGDGFWVVGEQSRNNVDEDNPKLSKQSRFTIPDGTRRVRFRVKPIAKTYTQYNQTISRFTASWSDYKYYTDSTPLATPSAPSDVSIDDLKLTVTMDGFESDITHVEFQIVQDHTSVFKTSSKQKIVTAHASYSCNVTAGSSYKVRCRIWDDDGQKSDWSPYSKDVSSKPSKPANFTKCQAIDKTSVSLQWTTVSLAKTYDIEYTTEESNFDLTDKTTTITGVTTTQRNILDLASGTEYFFRYRAVNEDGVASDWSNNSSITLGEKPNAPTTWSSTTTAVIGDKLILYWLHNTKDGSYQRYAEVDIKVNGKSTVTKIEDFDEDDADTISSYTVNTSKYTNDTTIEWRVRTRGVVSETSDWSAPRMVKVYTRPGLALSLLDKNGNSTETISSFPFRVKATATPDSQAAIGFHVSITPNETYETTDSIGNIKTVVKDTPIYSKYFDKAGSTVVHELDTELSAGDVDLENGVEYTISCTVSLNSGLTAQDSLTFGVSWLDVWCEPNATIAIDNETYTAYITPYCEELETVKYKVNYTRGNYVKTTDALSSAWGQVVPNVRTTTDEIVYSGVDGSGNDVYFCEVTKSTIVDNVLMSVYRREFDGSFVEIARDLDPSKRTTVSDPHPSLDLARYRIVATDKSTGTVSFSDLPGQPVDGKAVIIQWDEQWSSFEVAEDAEPAQPAWSGSLLKLPYNIDVSNSHRKDSTMVEYIGRAHPVSYYGTQIGESATWNVSIDANDVETLYALRRLARWMGDVYVREPSGSGYWANIEVSFSQKHREVTIPVTLEITRVEGGI